MALEVIGWSLLHSVWQGALVALVLWAMLQVIRDTLPHARYMLGLVALVSLLALPVLNYRQTIDVWQGHRTWLFNTADRVIQSQIDAGQADPDAVTAELRRRHADLWAADTGPVAAVADLGREPARALGWLWLAGALLLAGRLAVELRRSRRLTQTGRPDETWREMCRAVARRMGIQQPVRVRVTDEVDVPALVGWRWPVILVPRSVGDGDAEMNAILAHELAHVRRHDALVNFFQAVAEVLLFYSPAAWWISAQVREERECSCDLSAIPAVDGGPARYVRALLAIETARPRPTMAGALAWNGGSLVRRIRRVHSRARDARGIDWRNAALLLLLAAGLWSAAPEPEHPVPLAARVSATSLMLQDLHGMRVVVRTVELPGSWAAPEALDPTPCPSEQPGTSREA